MVLKGPGTVVAGPGTTYVDTFGDVSLATAGSGDVLAGLIAGLVGEFHHGREHYLPDRTHFLPMEAPQEFAAMVLDELRIAPGTR